MKKSFRKLKGAVSLFLFSLLTSALIVGCGNSESFVFTGTGVTVTGVDVRPATASVAVGGTQQYTVEITLSNGTVVDLSQFNGQIAWSSSAPATATVAQTGLATGVVPGTANITAVVTIPNGETFTDFGVLTVTAAPVPIPETSDRDSHTVTLTAPTASLVEGETLDDAFQLTLSAPAPVGGLTVGLTVSGTAESGVDYSSPTASGVTSVNVPAGQTSFPIALVSIDRPDFQPSRTVTVSVNESAAYSAGASSSGTVTITDSDELANPPGPGQVINRRTGENSTGPAAIQAVIDLGTTLDGDILDVGEGTYDRFNSSKEIILIGPNAGVSPTGTRDTEAIIQGPGVITTDADTNGKLTMDGFDIDAQIRFNGDNEGNTLIVKNCIFDASLSVPKIKFGNTNLPTIVNLVAQNNLFTGMTGSGSALQSNPKGTDPNLHSLVLTGNTVEGPGSDVRGFQFDNCGNVLVEGNTFRDLGAHAINIAGFHGVGGSHQILNNQFDNVSRSATVVPGDGPGAIILFYGFRDSTAIQPAGPITIQGNNIFGADTMAGIAIFQHTPGSSDTNFTNSNFSFNFNNLTPGAGPGFINPGPAPTGLIDLTQNWWGTATPAVGTEITGAGGATGLDFSNPLTGPIQ